MKLDNETKQWLLIRNGDYGEAKKEFLKLRENIKILHEFRIKKEKKIETLEKDFSYVLDSSDKSIRKIEKLTKALSMFTDSKSELFPLGEMLVMHGGCGDGQYICEYDRETIIKARKALTEIKEL